MKRLTFFSILATGVMLLSACGSPTPAPVPTAIPAQPTEALKPTPTVSPPPSPVPTQPAAEPTTAAAGGTRVQITLADNTITSTLTSFKVGVPYTFIIQNKGRHEHNFNIAPPVEGADGYADALSKALLAVDETQITPGGSTGANFTFPSSAAGAKLEFNCLIRRHYEDGMRLAITVTN